MVDIHSHILWGMDDGAPTEEVSLEMLRIAADSGTTDIVATPHSNGEFEYQPGLIDERIAYLMDCTGGTPRIHRGCDLHLSYDNIVNAIADTKRFAINGKRYVLVECSDLNISDSMDRVLDQLLGVDLIPIVTHPERNPILRKQTATLEKWVNLGCLVQVTALSVLGGFGKKAAASAHSLLAAGMVHFIASDAHDPEYRHPRLDECFKTVASRYGNAVAQLLFIDNPGKVIQGGFVSGDKIFVNKPGAWWQFWRGSDR